METIWALLKGETGEGCKAAEALILSEEEEEVIIVLFTMPGDTLVLFAGTVEGGEREESFVLLALVKYVGEAVSVLLILGDELGELGW